MNIEKIKHDFWGNCIRLSSGNIELLATLDFGPRIIRYGFIGGKNILKEDREYNIQLSGEEFKKMNGEGWKLYGGHRLWASPEAFPRTYYPDNNTVECIEIENGVILRPGEEVYNNMQKEIKIVMKENGFVDITHSIKNTSAWPQKFSLWAITVMSEGGTEVIPMPKKDTGLLPSTSIVLWPYAKMNDSRVYFGEDYIFLDQDKNSEYKFKLGINNQDGMAMYFNNNNMFIKRYDIFDEEYPDFGVSYETYTDFCILELETLSPLKTVQPDEIVYHKEYWELYDDIDKPKDEVYIKNILENMNK